MYRKYYCWWFRKNPRYNGATTIIKRDELEPSKAETSKNLEVSNEDNFSPDKLWQKGSYALRKLYHESKKPSRIKRYNTTLWISLVDEPGKLSDVTTMIGLNNVNISSVEMVEKTKNTINFRFNLIIHDLKNFTKLISELKQKEYNFKIIRHKNKKYAFFKRLFGGFKKN